MRSSGDRRAEGSGGHRAWGGGDWVRPSRRASAQVLRVVQSEQVFRAVERAKYEHERFYQATAMLGRALTVEQVIETAFDAAAAIVEYDVAAIALYDKAKARHKIAAVRVREGGAGLVDPEQLTNLEF